MKLRKYGLVFASALMSAAILGACGDSKKDEGSANGNKDADGLDTKIVTIATGESSGPYNSIGTTLAIVVAAMFALNYAQNRKEQEQIAQVK